MSLKTLQAVRLAVQSFWIERDPRERRLLALGGGVVLSAAIYLLAIAPAVQGSARLKQDMPELRAQSAAMQAMAAEVRRFAANPASSPPSSTRQDIEASLARNGLKAQNMAVSGDLIRVQMSAVAFSGVLRWLDELQKTARLDVLETSFTAQSQPDTVNVAVSLRQPEASERGERSR